MEQALTEDALLGGRIRIRQPRRGYRVNADTLLLASAVEAAPGMRLLEAGCGVGAALIAVAARTENAAFVGLERDANMAAIARENLAMNGMSTIAEIVTGDVFGRDANRDVFDGAFFNPPFDAEGEGRAPSAERRHAYIADEPVERWIAALADRLTGGAALTLIHRAHKLPEILRALEGRLGGVEIFPIRPRAEAPAKRVLARARKGSRAPLRLLKGLDLHDASGARHTPEAEALLRGETTLAWAD
ncbi:MAG: methyltransferase [Alphaproteobacteria bacterium]|nr:MAG: methyltransferase [Alphaproteobacteria bacterium]